MIELQVKKKRYAKTDYYQKLEINQNLVFEQRSGKDEKDTERTELYNPYHGHAIRVLPDIF